MKSTIDKLYSTKTLDSEELKTLIDSYEAGYLFSRAVERRKEYYCNTVYVRGLIEISNYCKNNCFYCGIRRDNISLPRYRLSKDEILNCTDAGYELGFRTFVLQGGEDLHYTDAEICSIVSAIKEHHPDCAVTLSIGEKDKEIYRAYKNAGADRYLLRHETADYYHYSKLHPHSMSLDTRKKCLWDLKELGFQVGSGFMVGSPYQTLDTLIKDLRFLEELQPDMIGIGPFLPHSDTPFANEPKGSLNRCLNLIAILRLMFPYALIPSTTALASISPQGREKGILAGANVVMPNLSPESVRSLYSLYNDKLSSGSEAAEAKEELAHLMKSIGYKIITDIGNVKKQPLD